MSGVRCSSCGEQAPYGDERLLWLDWHHSLLHRIAWSIRCRFSPAKKEGSRDCPTCDGTGCEECDGSGQRVTTHLSNGDLTLRVQGNAPLSDETKTALLELGRLAASVENDERETG